MFFSSLKACSVCQEWPSRNRRAIGSLCGPCWDDIVLRRRDHTGVLMTFLQGVSESSYPLAAHVPVLAMFAYQEAMRTLMRRVKVDDAVAALQDLEALWCASPLLHEWLGWADLVVAVPGSLWSRLRLKVDLAERLLIASNADTMASWPWSFYWRRWRKQSFRRHRSAHRRVELSRRMSKKRDEFYRQLARDAALKHGERLRILLIDDLLTSGQTLLELLPRTSEIDVRIAVLAYRANRVKKTDPVAPDN